MQRPFPAFPHFPSLETLPPFRHWEPYSTIYTRFGERFRIYINLHILYFDEVYNDSESEHTSYERVELTFISANWGKMHRFCVCVCVRLYVFLWRSDCGIGRMWARLLLPSRVVSMVLVFDGCWHSFRSFIVFLWRISLFFELFEALRS